MFVEPIRAAHWPEVCVWQLVLPSRKSVKIREISMQSTNLNYGADGNKDSERQLRGLISYVDNDHECCDPQDQGNSQSGEAFAVED